MTITEDPGDLQIDGPVPACHGVQEPKVSSAAGTWKDDSHDGDSIVIDSSRGAETISWRRLNQP